jgi:uncharacterized surface protein with fasciclin (FAS1) repeats
MKKITFNILAILSLFSLGMTTFSSCSDEPDADSFYTFKGKMMSEYLQSDNNFSEFATIVQRAGLMDQLSAYGHYTCFLPNNDAVKAYLNKHNLSSVADLSDSQCDTIARTHLLPEMFSVSDMADGMLASQNMIKRNVQVEHKSDANNNSVVVVNSNSTIYFEHQDDSVENGIVHQIDVVLENSTKTVGSLLMQNDEVSIFATAIHETGLDERMDSVEDRQYAKDYERYKNSKWAMQMLTTGSRSAEAVYYPESKKYGFTAFVVPDAVLKRKGINNIKELYDEAAKIYSSVYPEDVDKDGWKFENLKDSINPLKRLLQYHILDRNVQGYNFLTVREDAGIDINIVNPTDWYTTLLPYTMLKVEKLTVSKWAGPTGIVGDRYLNRRYDDTHNIYGVHIEPTVPEQYDNNAINGIYFYVDDILKFDNNTRDNVHNCRIRMDFSTIFPEIMTNNIRMNGKTITQGGVGGKNYQFPQGYLEGVILRGDSRLTYWYPRSHYWGSHGDEMDAQEVFDITFNLPPVPFSGEWQVRLGFPPMNKKDDHAERGQMQVYFDNKATGIPLNMAERIKDESVYGSTTFPDYANIRDDDEKRQEDFKILKNKGYYRGPHSMFVSSDGTMATKGSALSTIANCARKVLCTVYIEAGKPHTLRIKNVSTILPKRKEATLDYLELVPKSVYGVSDSGSSEDDL